MSLVLQNINFTYPKSSHGISDVDLTIETGELVAVIGPSGSGKSTLLKIIAGLTGRHSGEVFLNGEALSDKPVHKRDIGIVFQSYALFPHMNVTDNIAYGLKVRGIPKHERYQRATELLEIIGLEKYATSKISQLSGGQQQRIALARALAINPKALLLDEPLAALDASIRGHLRDQIRKLQQQFKATTLLVTHDQEEALTMADKVAVFKDGRLIQIASPKVIYNEPNSVDVAKFVGLSTILPATVSAHNEIDLGFAKFKVDTAQRSIGTQLHALFRPEKWLIDSTDDTNNICGTVGISRYLGAISRYDYHINDEATILIESTTLPQHHISISPDNIRLLDY